MFWLGVLSGKDLLWETGEWNTLVGQVVRERMGERERKGTTRNKIKLSDVYVIL